MFFDSRDVFPSPRCIGEEYCEYEVDDDPRSPCDRADYEEYADPEGIDLERFRESSTYSEDDPRFLIPVEFPLKEILYVFFCDTGGIAWLRLIARILKYLLRLSDIAHDADDRIELNGLLLVACLLQFLTDTQKYVIPCIRTVPVFSDRTFDAGCVFFESDLGFVRELEGLIEDRVLCHTMGGLMDNGIDCGREFFPDVIHDGERVAPGLRETIVFSRRTTRGLYPVVSDDAVVLEAGEERVDRPLDDEEVVCLQRFDDIGSIYLSLLDDGEDDVLEYPFAHLRDDFSVFFVHSWLFENITTL